MGRIITDWEVTSLDTGTSARIWKSKETDALAQFDEYGTPTAIIHKIDTKELLRRKGQNIIAINSSDRVAALRAVREPTEDQIEEARESFASAYDHEIRDAWKKMIDVVIKRIETD